MAPARQDLDHVLLAIEVLPRILINLGPFRSRHMGMRDGRSIGCAIFVSQRTPVVQRLLMIIEHASLTRAPLGSQQREGIINSLSLRVRVAMDARYLAIGEEGSFCFVERIPEDGFALITRPQVAFTRQL